MNEFELSFWQPSRPGQEFQFYTIELEEARIAKIQLEMLNNRYPENMLHKEHERASFEYKKVKWTYAAGGITRDEWKNRKL